jgi:hypothetical protein
MSSDDEGQDLVAEAIDFREPETPVEIAKKTTFLPWHRPRKQHVRVHQWCVQTRALAVRRKTEFSSRPLTYLGLPGDDLLDIRVLHDAVEPEGIKLRYLGFNSGKNVESSISEVEVNALPAIDSAKSRIVGDTFEAIAIPTTIAAKNAQEFAPFDVVNLDLCRSVATAAPGAQHSVFEALKRVLELQDKTQAGEWILFLTTHANPESVDEQALSILLQCIKDNAANHATFGPHLDRSLGVTAAGLDQPAGLESNEFALAFALGIGKWLLHAVAGQVRAWADRRKFLVWPRRQCARHAVAFVSFLSAAERAGPNGSYQAECCGRH